MKDFHFNEIIERKLLIVGDIGSGKTALTARLLTEALEIFRPNDITVIDMAPGRRDFKGASVGGRLTDLMNAPPSMRVLTPTPTPVAPRIEGLTAGDVLQFARSNHASIDRILQEYFVEPTPIVFMNDISMYLHAGEPANLLNAVGFAKTVVMNSYAGVALQDDHGSGLSQHERDGLALLKKAVDQVIALSAAPFLASQQETDK